MAKPTSEDQAWVLTVCAQDVHHSFLPKDGYSLKTAPLQRISWPTSLIQLYTIDHASYLLSAIKLPPCPAVCNSSTSWFDQYSKHTEFPGCRGFSNREPSLPKPTFSVRLSLSIFSSFLLHPQSDLSTRRHARTQQLSVHAKKPKIFQDVTKHEHKLYLYPFPFNTCHILWSTRGHDLGPSSEQYDPLCWWLSTCPCLLLQTPSYEYILKKGAQIRL